MRDSSSWDVIIVGAGIVGTAIARTLSQYQGRVLVVDRHREIGSGTSKANSAIIHTGFDAPVGSLEAWLLQRARGEWQEILADAPIPWVPAGAYMLARSANDLEGLDKYQSMAKAMEVAVERVSGNAVRDRIAAVSPAVLEALYVPEEKVVDPFSALRAFAEQAALNGVTFNLGHAVSAMIPDEEGVAVHVGDETLHARWVVNAGGLWGDALAQGLGDNIRLHPRKGQFLISEEDLGVHAILLPVPSAISKGITVTPIAFGGILLGPTAEDGVDKEDFGTTEESLQRILQETQTMVPGVAHIRSIRQFAGLRATSDQSDYHIQWSVGSPRVLHVLGIRSTGLSASVGIAQYVKEELQSHGMDLPERTVWLPAPALFVDEPAPDGEEVVCLCRSITAGEIQRGLENPVPAQTLDGIKRRTGAMLGECQGNICGAAIMDRVAAKHHTLWWAIPKGNEPPLPGVHQVRMPETVSEDLDYSLRTAITVVGGDHWGAAVAERLREIGLDPLILDAHGVAGTVRATLIELEGNRDESWFLTCVNQHGMRILRSQTVVLATGGFHRPPGLSQIAGERPAHVYTPDGLEQFWRRGVMMGDNPILIALGEDTMETILLWKERYREAGIETTVLTNASAPDLPSDVLHIQTVNRIQGRGNFESVMVTMADDSFEIFFGDVLCFSGGIEPMAPYLKHNAEIIRDERGHIVTGPSGRIADRNVWALPPLTMCTVDLNTLAREIKEALDECT